MRRFLIPTLAFLASSLAFVLAQAQHQADPVVIRLGNTTETLSQFERRFEVALRSVTASRGMEMTDEIRAQLAGLAPAYLEQRAQEFALVAEAQDRGLSVSDEDLEARIAEIRAGSADDAAFEQLLTDSGIGDEAMLRTLVRENELIGVLFAEIEESQSFEDAELRTAYLDRRERFQVGEQVCASHILLETVEDAEAAKAELDAGADFAELAVERSTGPSGPSGGDLGCFGRGQMVGPFEEAAFAAEVGVPTGPVETQFGQHLILVSERQEATVRPFGEVRDELSATLASEATERVIGILIDTSGVVTYPDRLATPPAPEGEPGDSEPGADAPGADEPAEGETTEGEAAD